MGNHNKKKTQLEGRKSESNKSYKYLEKREQEEEEEDGLLKVLSPWIKLKKKHPELFFDLLRDCIFPFLRLRINRREVKKMTHHKFIKEYSFFVNKKCFFFQNYTIENCLGNMYNFLPLKTTKRISYGAFQHPSYWISIFIDRNGFVRTLLSNNLHPQKEIVREYMFEQTSIYDFFHNVLNPAWMEKEECEAKLYNDPLPYKLDLYKSDFSLCTFIKEKRSFLYDNHGKNVTEDRRKIERLKRKKRRKKERKKRRKRRKGRKG